MINSIILGDCLEKLKEIPENSVDSIVTDPPYELGFMGKSWDNTGIANNKQMWSECLRVLKPGGHLLSFSGTRTYHRMASAIEDAGFEVRDMIEWVYSTGFPKSLNLNKALQKKCKCGNMEVYDNERAKQNTEHNLRPVSETNLSQEINTSKEQGEVLQSELSKQGISLQQSKSTENIRSKESLLEGGNNNEKTEGQLQGCDLPEMSESISSNGEEGRLHNATQISNGSTPEQTTNEDRGSASHRPQSEQQQDRKPCAFCKQLGTQETRRLYEETYGVGSALKPAHEPICLARKPLSEKTLVDNFIKYGTGGINIDESRVKIIDTKNGFRPNSANKQYTPTNSFAGGKITEQHPQGRFPANLIHDGSDEVKECFPETNKSRSGGSRGNGEAFFGNRSGFERGGIDDNGGNASRFFKSIIYQAKASKSERNKGCEGLEEIELRGGGGRAEQGYDDNDPEQQRLKDAAQAYGAVKAKKSNFHPTVKPIALMTYLIKMVTPKGGIVLDPFTGSGTTLVAAKENGYQYIGIEMTPEYIPIIEARLKNLGSKQTTLL